MEEKVGSKPELSKGIPLLQAAWQLLAAAGEVVHFFRHVGDIRHHFRPGHLTKARTSMWRQVNGLISSFLSEALERRNNNPSLCRVPRAVGEN